MKHFTIMNYALEHNKATHVTCKNDRSRLWYTVKRGKQYDSSDVITGD